MNQKSEKINNLIENIKNLTLLEAYDLVKELEKTFEIEKSLVAPMQAFTVASNNGNADQSTAPSAAAQEKTAFDVSLTEVPGDKKIGILKIVRTITGLGLKESKDIVDNVPKTLKEGVSKEEAEKIKAELETAGAKVLIK
jgi:large subunit ribosomal protein L7/L12